MAKYRVQSRRFFMGSRLYDVGEIVEIPDGIRPASNLELLMDQEAPRIPDLDTILVEPPKTKRRLAIEDF